MVKISAHEAYLKSCIVKGNTKKCSKFQSLLVSFKAYYTKCTECRVLTEWQSEIKTSFTKWENRMTHLYRTSKRKLTEDFSRKIVKHGTLYLRYNKKSV
jgi:hypothetical protein